MSQIKRKGFVILVYNVIFLLFFSVKKSLRKTPGLQNIPSKPYF